MQKFFIIFLTTLIFSDFRLNAQDTLKSQKLKVDLSFGADFRLIYDFNLYFLNEGSRATYKRFNNLPERESKGVNHEFLFAFKVLPLLSLGCLTNTNTYHNLSLSGWMVNNEKTEKESDLDLWETYSSKKINSFSIGYEFLKFKKFKPDSKPNFKFIFGINSVYQYIHSEMKSQTINSTPSQVDYRIFGSSLTFKGVVGVDYNFSKKIACGVKSNLGFFSINYGHVHYNFVSPSDVSLNSYNFDLFIGPQQFIIEKMIFNSIQAYLRLNLK